VNDGPKFTIFFFRVCLTTILLLNDFVYQTIHIIRRVNSPVNIGEGGLFLIRNSMFCWLYKSNVYSIVNIHIRTLCSELLRFNSVDSSYSGVRIKGI
jgi:hypothetical protein